MPRFSIAPALLLALGGCYASHGPPEPPLEPVPCDEAPPACTRRDSPCDPMQLVDAVCDGDLWRCPDGAERYRRPWADDRCLPLEGRALMSDGVNESPVPVPIDGRCTWVFPVGDGDTELASSDVGRSCGELGELIPVATDSDEADYLAVQASFVDGSGTTRVLGRGWVFDSAEPFGVRALGVALGRVDGRSIELGDLAFLGLDVDLGDAAVVDGDFLYAYGSPGDPDWIEEDSIVARAPLASLDDASTWQILGTDGWGVGEPVRVFGTGPHRGAVVRDPRSDGFVHVYAVGFGSTVEVTESARPEGPWSAARTLHRCELPTRDPDAYCAGPLIHLELFDPMAPNELVVSYSIGTTSPDQDRLRREHPEDYWPRVMRVTR